MLAGITINCIGSIARSAATALTPSTFAALTGYRKKEKALKDDEGVQYFSISSSNSPNSSMELAAISSTIRE